MIPEQSSSGHTCNNRVKSKKRGHKSSEIESGSESTDRVLYLQQSHVTFEAPTLKEYVFFDECNREVISLTTGVESKTCVIFQSSDRLDKVKFLLPVDKRILSIKLNSTRTVLAYHIEKSNVEFINVLYVTDSESGERSYTLDSKRYVQSTKARNGKLSGFLWTGPQEMVMITDISVEYYHVDSHRHRLRYIKSFSSSTNWFVYQPSLNRNSRENTGQPYSMLVVSSGSMSNTMQPYMFVDKQVLKLQKFDVEGDWHGGNRVELFERSITIASIYGMVRLLVLQHESLNVKSRGAQILIYTIDCESGESSKTHSLDLDISGRFAINVVDNLIIAHDQPSKSSFIFDIMIESTEKSDCPKHFVSLLDRKPIRHLRVKDRVIDMYSLNWVFFQPNVIIDAKMGLLCTLHLDLDTIRETIADDSLLLTFLSHRTGGETIIVDKVCEITKRSYELATCGRQLDGNPLADVSSAFDLLSHLVQSPQKLNCDSIDLQNQAELSNDAVTRYEVSKKCYNSQICQDDLYRKLFEPLRISLNETHAHISFATSILLEFILMMRKQNKNVDYCIYETLLKILADGGRFYQIIQMIRSGILEDSKQLACLLLSLRSRYKPAAQLGIDMLQRLDCLIDLVDSMNLNSDTLNVGSGFSRRLSDVLYESVETGANQ